MLKTAPKIAWVTLFFGGATFAACSSDKGSPSGAAGAVGTGGGMVGAGAGGMAGAACGDPPVTEHGTCANFPSLKMGDAGFTITSPDFAFCGVIPAANTCNGNDFGSGTSPAFSWSGAPAGTMSFAVIFKDISILADNDPASEPHGYHWVMWDIPATVTGLPEGMTGGFHSVEVPGALQWSSLGSYGFFTPCPNPFPNNSPMFACGLTDDSYSLTLYALPMAKLGAIPAPDVDDAGAPVAGSNWVLNMGQYLETLQPLAVTEYRGTSKAWAGNFVPPSAAEYPCTEGMAGAGGASAGAGGIMCLQ